MVRQYIYRNRHDVRRDVGTKRERERERARAHGGWMIQTSFRNFIPIIRWEVVVGLHDLLKQQRQVLVVEWWETTQQNVGDDTNAPQINLLVVSRGAKNLRSFTNTKAKRTCRQLLVGNASHIRVRTRHAGIA
jgi:hypothetical protein